MHLFNAAFLTWVCSAVVAIGCTTAPSQLTIKLDAATPYKVELTDNGAVLVISTQSGAPPELIDRNDECVLADAQLFDEAGWAVTEIRLARTVELESVSYSADPSITLQVSLTDIGPGPERFGDIDSEANALPLIVIDPGHGGIDSGAVRDGHNESELMLSFSRLLAETLVRSGRFRVALTRNEDRFLRLSDRVRRARHLGADAFLSLHADALEEGKASGAAVFTLSEEATDATAAELVEVHDRSDVLPGAELQNADDQLASVVVELAQKDNVPRSLGLANALVEALHQALGSTRKEAQRSADFGVLKAPDVPSVLIELGFMSDPDDLANLLSDEWRRTAAGALRDGLISWVDADRVAAGLRRN